MSAPSPYQIEIAMSALMSARARLLNDDPELASDEAALAEALGAETGDAIEVLHRMVRASLHAKRMAESADERAREIAERRDRYKRRAEALRGAAFAAMDALGMRRLELPDLTASVTAGRPGVVIVDETAIPDQFMRVHREPDKSALLLALKSGDVAGAALSNGLPTIQVRTR